MLLKAGSVLSRAHADLVVSKYRLRQAEGVALVRSKRDAGQQTLGFTSRPFVFCGLPLRRPPVGQLKHERRNGRFTLQVVGHPDFGVPFGQDRLVPVFLATLAVRQKSPIVRFSGGQEVLDMFGLARGGKEYRRMVSAFERVFGATIFFADESGGVSRVVHRARFHFMSEARIWHEGSGENEIVLSDDFYREITAHPIPVDLEAVKARPDQVALAHLPLPRGRGSPPHSAINDPGGLPISWNEASPMQDYMEKRSGGYS